MTIPVSGERLSAASPPVRNISHSLATKRPRLDDGPNLPAHASSMPALPSSLNLSSLAGGGGNSGMPQYPYRIEVDMSSGYPVQTNITPLPPAPGLPPTQSASHPSLQYANPGIGIGMNGAGSGGLLGSQSAPAGLFPQLGHGSFGMDLGGGGHPPTLRAMSFPGSQGHSQAGSASPFTPQQSSGPTYQQRQSAAAAAMAMELLARPPARGRMVEVGRVACHRLTGLSMEVVNRIHKTVVRIVDLHYRCLLTTHHYRRVTTGCRREQQLVRFPLRHRFVTRQPPRCRLALPKLTALDPAYQQCRALRWRLRNARLRLCTAIAIIVTRCGPEARTGGRRGERA